MSEKNIVIALDAMGGDHAPKEICAGALRAVETYDDIEIVLTGDKEIFVGRFIIKILD